MSEFDPKQFEHELQTLRPAKPSPKLLEHIRVQLRVQSNPVWQPVRLATPQFRWNLAWRWLVPASALAAVAALVLFAQSAARRAETQPQPRAASKQPMLKADKVEIDRQLVADFDTITETPGGQPMRFRCEQWLDRVRLRDSAAGLTIERTTPRVEIVPVRFETY
jgi:hypothetical protein